MLRTERARASRYRGLPCTSISRDGHRCDRDAGHSAIRGSATHLHHAVVGGVPHVWERD